MPTSAQSFPAGIADRYRIERELGRGGMATVYLAVDLRHDRPVALKLLHPELAHALGPERFLREIRTTARLQHPHILPVHDSGETAGRLWYTMPYVAGESLRERLRREPRLPLADAVRLAREIADALAYAHERGVVHRDIKPENVLLARGHALVADFGVAQAAGELGGERLTGTGLALGTPAYMSPEQAAGSQALDGRSDIYALGCVLYEMCAGAPPWVGPTPQAAIARRFVEVAPSVRLVRAEVPVAVDRALAKALAREPADRFPTAGEFRRALSHAQPPAAADGSSRKRLLGTFWLALAVMLMAATASVLAWRTRSPPDVLDADLVAVAPFDVFDPTLQLWHEGLVDLLSRALDGAGPLRTVSATTVVRRWRGRSDAASAAALGRQTGAGLTVYGTLVPAGADSVRLSATVLDANRGRPIGEYEVRAGVASMDRLVDSLAMGLLRELARTRSIGAIRQVGIGARTLPALKAFLQAEQQNRLGAWDSARVYAEQAVALDTGFALAYRRLSNAIGWQAGSGDPVGYEYRQRAFSLNHGLAPRDSLLLLSDSLIGPLTEGGFNPAGSMADPASAARLFEVVNYMVGRYPDDPEAWYALGEARYHTGVRLAPTDGWRATFEAFERSITLDSLFGPSYFHLVEVSYDLGDTARARRFADAMIRLNPQGEQSRGLQILRGVLAARDTADQGRRLDSLPLNLIPGVYGTVARWPEPSELAVRIARRQARLATDAWETEYFRHTLAQALAFRGHVREALPLSDLHNGTIVTEAALLGLVPDSEARARFESWLRDGVDRRPLSVPAVALPWWSAQGDTASIRRFLRVVESAARDPWLSTSRDSIRLSLMMDATRAQLALARRDTAAALRYYGPLLGPPSYCAPWCQVHQLQAAQLLAARGRLDAAARVLNRPPLIEAGVSDVSPGPRLSDVLWYLERGRIAERLGDSARAVGAYRFVVAAWRRPDAELQPYVEQAREGLVRLTAEPVH